MTLREEDAYARAQRAQALFTDPLFQEIVQATTADLHNQWELEDDPAKREELHGTIRGMRRFLEMWQSEMAPVVWQQAQDALDEEKRREAADAEEGS